MFEFDKMISIQKKFSQVHNYIILIVLVYMLSLSFIFSTLSMGSMFWVIVFLLIYMINMILSKNDFYKKIGLVYTIRTIELFACAYFSVYNNMYPYSVAIAVTIYIFLLIEIIFLFDVCDSYYRIPYVLYVALPVTLFVIFKCIFQNELVQRSLLYFFLVGIIVVLAYCISTVFAEIIKEYTEKLFTQARIISNSDKANEALIANQRKIKKANELLGLQKIELEVAYNKINRSNAEMTIQSEILKYVSKSLEIETLMELIIDSISGYFGTVLCSIIMNDMDHNEQSNNKVTYKIQCTLHSSYLQNFKECIQKNYFEELIRSQKVIIDNKVTNDKYDFVKNNELGSLLILPLVKNTEPFGVLVVGHTNEACFENINFFEAIVSQFLIAIDNARLYSKMENMAIRDGLTGIYNRGHLTKLYNEHLNDSILNKKPLSVALYDIDKFKNVNDTYGHPFGDVVIKEIAKLSEDIVKEYDCIVGRYGGEEFVILLPNKELNEAYDILNKIHCKIKEKELFHNKELVHVNVSIGITSYPEICQNPSELLDRADNAMYYSKQNGRGRITIDSEEIRAKVKLK